MSNKIVSNEEIRAIETGPRKQSRRNLRTTSMANLKFVDSSSSYKTNKT